MILNTDDRSLRQIFHRRLIRWFEHHGRALPWRETRDPYPIHVSEIMLQQTQVERVLEYYGRFLKKYPTTQHLARARESGVLRAWTGLGYYARARNLHAAARIIVQEYDGHYPETVEALIALPGIGRSTAGAILSFACNVPAVVLDTNIARVIRRVFLGDDGANKPMDAALWQYAEVLLPGPARIWAYNQGVMDFGATVCTSYAPKCDRCFLADQCRWRNATVEESGYPALMVAEPKPAGYRKTT
jgi:A/G-specific adenine glycosylase